MSFFGVIWFMSLVQDDDEDIFWVRFQCVFVSVNEFMYVSGKWQYFVDEVQDGFGNVVKYIFFLEDLEGKVKFKELVQDFFVKECLIFKFDGCDLRNLLRVVRGDFKELLVKFGIGGMFDLIVYSLSWFFLFIDIFIDIGDYGDVVLVGIFNVKNVRDKLRIFVFGFYIFKFVFFGGCEGEVWELFFCLFLNFFELKFLLCLEEILDICVGNLIGFQVDFYLIGILLFIF